MSKYIDKDKVLEYIIFGVVGKDITCGELTRAIESLPTIEVNEDCISREWVLEKFEKGRETISKSEYFDELIWLVIHAPSVVPSRQRGVIGQGSGDIDWQAVTSAGQEIYAKGYEDGRKSVEVSEDVINGFKDGQKEMLMFLLEGMKNALEQARKERIEE